MKVQSLEYYYNGIINSNTVILSQAITLIESTKSEHQEIAEQIIERCLPYSGNSIRIGITGIPGVGKSTFIEALGQQILTIKNQKIAVLAVDPSSNISKGSILGDKTRMNKLAGSTNVYIRPSASGSFLGGVTQKTHETIILCEAAGYNNIIIETVGVGQSEIEVNNMVDITLLLMITGAGDELQGMKKGIMETANIIAINKADGNNELTAKQHEKEIKNVLHLLNNNDTQVLSCSALQNTNIDNVITLIQNKVKISKENNSFQNKRKSQLINWMNKSIELKLINDFYAQKDILNRKEKLEQSVIKNEISPFKAAKKLISKT